MRSDNIDVIYNGMDFDEFKNLDNISYDKIDQPYILYLGRLDKLKGINHIIEAFSKLPPKFSNYKLIIAGKINDYKKTLDEIIQKHNLKDRVIFTGFIKQSEKIALFKDASLFINPVKYMGGVSLTVFESILAGTPVIVTRQSGEVIEKIDAGLIVKYADVDELKDTMIKSLTDEKLTQKQLENGQNYIYNNLSWSDVTDKIIEVYKKHVNKGDI